MIKNYITLIVALVALLGSFQSVITFERLSSDYEGKLSKNYSIIVVCKEEIASKDISSVIENIISVKRIDVSDVIENIDNRLTGANISELQEELPIFYRVKLSYLPSKYELFSIEDRLKEVKSIIRVEGFAHVQNRISALFEIVSYILTTFTFLFFILALIVVVKQTIIWRYAHRERLYIMAILGARFWIRSKSLYKMVVISSLTATGIVASLFSLFAFSSSVINSLKTIGLEPLKYYVVFDSLILLCISLCVSLLSLTTVALATEKTK